MLTGTALIEVGHSTIAREVRAVPSC